MVDIDVEAQASWIGVEFVRSLLTDKKYTTECIRMHCLINLQSSPLTKL